MSATRVPARLHGTLRVTGRGYRLHADDGQVWRVEGAEPFAALAEQTIVVEAYRRAPNLLELLWAGPAI
ncbi:DUF5818 domain-containing protein [Sphingopyxis sp. GC21]|uniref:DUF5818 domain-containing protein n=1 Tax=Sphingopyxis sp. GC21 TaxID=2933562 RepID=UPI0021E4DE15|nr:DUF5818 domain-containing protein [Sphingopyxis sp. GC21]